MAALSPAKLRRRPTTGARIERTRRAPPQGFRQKLFISVGQGVGADVRRALGSFMRCLIVLESSLHVDAVNGIVDAMLNVSEVAHEILLSAYRSACSPTRAGERWRSDGCAARISPRSSGLRTDPDSRHALGVLGAECGLVAGVAAGDADMNLVTLPDRE